MAELFRNDMGVTLQVLADNYDQWALDFKVLAIAKGVWDLYTGDLKVMVKPDKAKYIGTSEQRLTRKKTEESDYDAAIAEYKLDLDEYKDNAKLVREAVALLASWVDPAIRSSVFMQSDPKSAWDFVKAQYKMTDTYVLDRARNRMNNAKLSYYKTIPQYLNAIQGMKLDVQEAGGKIDDDEVIRCIIRGLPSRYDTFIDLHDQLVDMDGFQDGLKGFTARLLTFGTRLQQRQARGTGANLFNFTSPPAKCRQDCYKSPVDTTDLPRPMTTSLTLPTAHREALEPYLPSITTNSTASPFHLTLTYAQSLDASLSLSPDVQTVLSGPETKAMTHFLRSRHASILVGVGTALADDPSLNCRFAAADGKDSVGLEGQPWPIVLDPSARWDVTSSKKVVSLAREGKGKGVLWITGVEVGVEDERRKVVESVGGTVIVISALRARRLKSGGGDNSQGVKWGLLISALRKRRIHSLMVEGGGKVIEDLLREENRELVSSVIVTMAPVWLGRGGVLVCPRRKKGGEEREVGRLRDVRWVGMGEDVVLAGRF